MDQEEVEAFRVRESGSHLHAHFLFRANRALLSCDLDQATCTLGPSLINKALRESLVGTSDHLMDRELEAANVVM